MTVTLRASGDLLTAAIFNTKLEAPLLTAEYGAGSVTGAAIAAGAVTSDKVAIVPACRIYHAADQAVASAIGTYLTFGAERWDTLAMHDLVTNSTRMTCKQAGLYRIGASVAFAESVTGRRSLAIWVNGVTPIAHSSVPGVSGSATYLQVAAEWVLAVNDYVEINAYHEAGVSLSVLYVPARSPEAWVSWIGRIA